VLSRAQFVRTLASTLLIASAAPFAVRAQEEGEPAPVDEVLVDPEAEAVIETPPALLRPLPAPLSREVLDRSKYGLSVFLWNNPTTTKRDLTTLQLAGVGWQKSLFQWREIEGKGKYMFDWREADRVVEESNKAGIKILARIDFSPGWTRKNSVWRNARPDDFQHFADFLRVFADRYKAGSGHGRVHAVEIWNEPNLEREWGTPISKQSATDYVTMLKLAYKTVKAIDPSMLVVTAGLSPTGWDDDTARPDDTYLRWMFEAGAVGHYDVLGVHGNSQASDPTAEPGSIAEFAHPSFYFRRVEQLRAIQGQYGDALTPMWILEFGWTSDTVNPNYSWFAVSEEQKAENILAAMKYARAHWSWVELMFLWTLPDPTWGPDREELWWAIANADGTPRPALERLIDTAQQGMLP
jgi:hypothetical protein